MVEVEAPHTILTPHFQGLVALVDHLVVQRVVKVVVDVVAMVAVVAVVAVAAMAAVQHHQISRFGMVAVAVAVADVVTVAILVVQS